MLAWPFRVRPNGRVATVEDDSDEAVAQQLALLMLIEPGERPLVPEYGVPDPTYDLAGADGTTITAAIAAFGPQVTVDDVTETATADPTASDVRITFTR